MDNKEVMKQEARYDFLKEEVHCLSAEKIELQVRIDKAIEYIKNNGDEIVYSYDKSKELIDVLLDILKGSEDNE